MDDQNVRLARLEIKQDTMLEQMHEIKILIEKKFDAQKEHNDLFYQTRDHVHEMRAKAGILSVVFLGAASIVAWLTNLFTGK